MNKLYQKLLLIYLLIISLISVSACSIDVTKYQAYKGDKVVATVNGVNLYYSEVQTKMAYDKASYDYTMELINKGEYNLDIYPAPVLKTEDEILDEIIKEEALYQYYVSDAYTGEKLLYDHNTAVEHLSASINSYKNNPDEPLATLGLELQEQYYDILKMNEKKWIEYKVPFLTRQGAANNFKKAYKDTYNNHQSTGGEVDIPTLEEKINEILDSFDISKLANN